MCIAKGCTIWLHRQNVFDKTEDFGFSFTSDSNQYFMPEYSTNLVIPALAVPYKLSKDKSETQEILAHRDTYNNIEALMRALLNAMKENDKQP